MVKTLLRQNSIIIKLVLMEDAQGYIKYQPRTDGYENGNNQLALKKLDQSHEGKILDKKNQQERELIKLRNNFNIEKLKKNLGWLGRCFGNSQNSSQNITALICCVLLLIVLVASCILYSGGNYFIMTDLWSQVLPIITLALGYLFGKN